MSCQNGDCEYKPSLKQVSAVPISEDERRYAELWAEVELSKQDFEGWLKECVRRKKNE